MDDDWVLFLSVTLYIFIFIIAFVASVILPVEDKAKEEPIREIEWIG